MSFLAYIKLEKKSILCVQLLQIMHHFPVKALRTWFLDNARDLPWRGNPSPYAVWVSEIMLQQTRVAVVIPYFLRWMERFPTVKALSEAPEEEVLKYWEGLGYYSRVRNLHAGAKQIIADFGGFLPNNPDDLKKIKGIGPYTIGAILSFAFKQKAAAVDGNVLRVLTRFCDCHEDITQAKPAAALRSYAECILPEEEPWIISEALIELGATVCSRDPLCHQCPLASGCLARARSTVNLLPKRPPKAQIQTLHRLVGLITAEEKILIRKVAGKKIMAGLYEFPYIECDQVPEAPDLLVNFIKHSLDLNIREVKSHSSVKHHFTRYQAILYPFRVQCAEPLACSEYEWKSIPELAQCSFPSGHRSLLNLLFPV